MSDYRPQPKVTILKDWKLRLSADPVNGSKRRPSLTWNTSAKGFVIQVYTNVDSDHNGGQIKAILDIPTFFAFTGMLEKAIESQGTFMQAIECKDYTWINRKRSDTPVKQAKLVVGKDDAGMVYIAVTSDKTSKVVFRFKVPFLYDIKTADGEMLPEAEGSKMYAKAYLKALSAFVPELMRIEYKGKEDKSNQGNSNNNYSGGNGGGNYSNKQNNTPPTSNDFDDELPF